MVYCSVSIAVSSLNAKYQTAGYSMGATEDWLFAETFDGNGNRGGTGTTNIGGVLNTGAADSAFYSTALTVAATPVLQDGLSDLGGLLGANADIYTWLANTGTGQQPAIVIGVNPSGSATLASLAGVWVGASLTSSATVYGSLATSAVATDGSLSGSAVNLSSAGVVSHQTLSGPANTFAVGAGGQVTNGGTGGGSGYLSADGNLLLLTNVSGANPSPGLTAAVRQSSGLGLGTFQGVYALVTLGGTGQSASYGVTGTVFAHGDGTYTMTFMRNQAGTLSSGSDSGTYTLSSNGALVLTSSAGGSSSGQISADGNVLVLASIGAGQKPSMTLALRQ